MKLLSTTLSVIVSLVFSYSLNAQVGISESQNFTPQNNAILDVNSENSGVLIPRIALENTTSISMLKFSNEAPNSLLVYNTATAGTSPNNVTPGFYYWNGEKWMKILHHESEAKPMVFYAPSIALPIEEGTHEIDLYQEYQNQFGTPVLSSNVDSNLVTYSKDQLAYFITYLDEAVFTAPTLTNDGKLTYTVPSNPNVTDKTFINAVFKVRN
ncbi:MAG TPA: hypothetical protein VIG94_11550 [Faecalibacter sp.]